MSPEQPSFDQIRDQYNAGHKNMTVLVERSGGKISTGDFYGKKKMDGGYMVNVEREDGSVGYREVPEVALSDEKQAELAEKLAGQPLLELELGHEAVDAAGVEEPDRLIEEALLKELDALNEGVNGSDPLNETDRVALFRYATALFSHETESARKKMSLNLQNDGVRLQTAKNLWSQIRAIRDAKS